MLKAAKTIDIQEGKLRKSFYKRGQRDYLKKLITELQDRLGVRMIVTRNLHSVDSCIDALCKLIKDYKTSHIPKEDNLLVIARKEIAELKSLNKKLQEKKEQLIQEKQEEKNTLKSKIGNLKESISMLEKEKIELENSKKEEGILLQEIKDLKGKINRYKSDLDFSRKKKIHFQELYEEKKLSLEKLKSKKWWQIWK